MITVMETDLIVGEENISNDQVELTASENLLVNDSMGKVLVLYNDCEIEDSINSSNEEKCEPGIMLGSFTHVDDPEAVIFTRYDANSEIEDKDLDGEIGPIEMTFETGVDGHIDQLIIPD